MKQFKADESRDWDGFVSNASNGHLFQSWAWGEFKSRYGWQPVRVALLRDGQIRGAAQLLFRSVAGLSVAYVPRGPVTPVDDPETYSQLLDAIHQIARKRHSVFLKVQPNEPAGLGLEKYLRRKGFLQSSLLVGVGATLVVDLTGGPEAVMARLQKRTRYNIRLAERRGVEVRFARDDADLKRFHELMVETGARADFRVRSLRYYQDLFHEFKSRDQAELLLAEFDGQVIAGMMRFVYGKEGVCLYGASNREYSRDKPNYLLQWKAMEWCMQRGCARYDLWGIPGAAVDVDGLDKNNISWEKDRRAELWGVYEFKRNFADYAIRYAGAFDYPYMRPLYLAWVNLGNYFRKLL